MSSRYPLLVALLGPVLLIGSTWLGLESLLDPSTAEARLRTAGRVLNGSPIGGSVARAMEEVVDEAEPEVVIIGNSIANRNFRTEVIAQKLGLPAAKVVALTVPGSVGSHFYAILKNRIYTRGRKVPLVLVIGTAQSLLLVDPWSEAGRIDLTIQLSDDEPLIHSMVSSTSVWWQVTQAKRAMIRDTFLNTVRDGAIGLFLDNGRDGALTEKAMRQVFHESRLDFARHGNALPIVQPLVDVGTIEDIPRPAASMIPHLAALATEYGSKLVVVRSPQSPAAPPEELDLVPEGALAELKELLEAQGHTFVDMSGTPLKASMFADSFHANDEAAATLSALLGIGLREAGMYGPSDAPWFHRAPAPRAGATMGSAPPADGMLGERGGRWLEPGEALELAFDTGWTAPAAYYQVHFVGEQLPGASAPSRPPTLVVAGQEWSVAAEAMGPGHTRYRALVRGQPPAGPWTLRLTAAADGGPLHVAGLRLGRGPGARMLVGELPALLANRYDLFGQVELVDGVLGYRGAAVAFDRDPPEVKAIGPREFGAPMRGVFHIPSLRFLADTRTVEVTPLGLRCSPLRVLEDGAALSAGETCEVVMPRPRGKTCHAPERLVFGSTDGTAVLRSGHRYDLVLDPERRCWGARWLYPHDVATISVEPEVVQRFRDGMRGLGIAVLRPLEPGAIKIRMWLDEALVLDRRIELETGKSSNQQVVAFDEVLYPVDHALRLELTGDEGYNLVTSLELRERR